MKTNLPTYIEADARAAIVPVKYIAAVKALQACQTIDDANQWSNKADALAAWAKIYKSDEAGKEARKLKLHAYRKMGELAERLRPTPQAGNRKNKKGASSLLREHGLTSHKAREAMALSRATDAEFSAVVTEARGISASAAQFAGLGRPAARTSSDDYGWLCSVDGGLGLRSFIGRLHKKNPRDVAHNMRADEREKARVLALEIVNWFDELERCIPKKTN